MSTVFSINTFPQLNEAISTIRRQGFSHGTVYLHGGLGAGKTAFTACWLRQLGLAEPVTSPSYGIVNEYEIPNLGKVIHADLYRLTEPEELLYLDAREWPAQAVLCFIEWPEQGEGFLPPADAIGKLTFNGRERMLHWTNCVTKK